MSTFEIPNEEQEIGPLYTVRKCVISSNLEEILEGNKNDFHSISMLDVGCGKGILILELVKLIKRLNCDCSLTLLELDKGALEEAKKRLKSQSIAKVNFCNKNLLDYFPKEKFDIVLISEVLEHFKDDLRALTHVREQILKNSGTLILTVPSFKEGGKVPKNPLNHYRVYDKKLLKLKLEVAGYEIKKINYFGGYLLESYLKLIKKRVGRKGQKRGRGLSNTSFKIYKILHPIILSLFRIDHQIFSGRLKNCGLFAMTKKSDELLSKEKIRSIEDEIKEIEMRAVIQSLR